MDFQDEDSKVEFLTSMMGSEDPETARQILRKHNGNVEIAAQTLLEGTVATGTSDANAAPNTPPRKPYLRVVIKKCC
jgi:hypothetical protein